MKEATKLPELPRLPKGQGTLIYTHGNKILYRKAIPVDGGYKRLAVTGNNIRECFDTMRRKEDDLRAGMKSAGSESLAMAIDRWLDLYKQPEVKPSSYDRLRITYKAQITKMTIADKPWKLITADELQAAVNALVQDGYAWSTVKKAYDMLNAFYTFQTRRGYLPRSPMDICCMPLRENMLKRDKEIVYMTEPQIKVFCEEALSFAEGSTQLKYRYGPAFVFLIYTGLRIGELCALQWKDFNMEKATVSITKNLIEVYNRDYGKKREGAPQYVTKISTTKTRSTRIIPLNRNLPLCARRYHLRSQTAMWSPQPTGSPLHRARWKSDLLICCKLRPWICRPAAAICCAIPARVCCLQRSCRWRSLPASWDTAPKFAAKPTSTSAKPNAPRPSTRLLNSISKNKFGERKWKMLTLPEKGGIVTLLNPGSETGGGIQL